ncbi:hypothetical protein ACEN2J_18760 [Pseudorhodobacter sp. W20_MBD10_FR17]|uniref:hypothetical protein n=1 Tax=Pseudorhodobacter sp. W20_MBD10_FR17 TaxID=3240266 RepID=UPI003F9DEE48
MNKNSKTPTTAVTDLFTTGLQNMARLRPVQTATLNAWSDLGGAAWKFTSLRMQQDVEAKKVLLGCKCFEDVQKVQTDFFSKAIADCQAEAAHMMKIVSTPFTQAQISATPSTKRGYDNVPL